jgi:hypothetical protein
MTRATTMLSNAIALVAFAGVFVGFHRDNTTLAIVCFTIVLTLGLGPYL